MAQIKRESANKPNDIAGGPYLAKVVSHLDPSFMGGLEVTLLKSDGNTVGDVGQTYGVRYCSPFFGATAFEFQGYNKDDYNDTQKSYGMWFVPPDIGVTVIVFFIDGDPSKGYWLGCVPDRFANHMVPGIAKSSRVEFAPGEAEFYDTNSVPVAEVNRRAYGDDLENNTEIDKVSKPVHPIAEHFREAGTLEDVVRGAVFSTSRRNVPSSIYGISTPGPLDRRPGAKKSFVGKVQTQSPTPVPVSRLGGSQFVMDDGDDRYQRRTPAGDGPPDYADLLSGDSGEPTIPFDEYIRLRTRTGHQVLLHNSEDLIYISNSKGTAWIELSSDGKIDIFAQDSVSIHTKQDFNFYADRDVNIEAGRNINMKASAAYAEGSDSDANGFAAGRIFLESVHDTKILVGGGTKISTSKDLDINTLQSTQITSAITTNIYSLVSNYITAEVNNNIKASASNYFQAGVNTNIKSGGVHLETATQIHMNGPGAEDATRATPAVPCLALGLNGNIIIDPAQADWVGTRYNSGILESIMGRIPMHEPWPGHENQDPLSVKPELTDRELGGGGGDGASLGGGGEEEGGDEGGGGDEGE